MSIRSICCCVLLLALLPSRGVALDYEWGWVPVGGGGNLMMTAYHPTDPSLVALRSDVGGCFVRDPSRADGSWRSLLLSSSFSLEDAALREPSGFAFDPGDPRTLYVSCANGLYQTLDGGTTWSRILETDMRITHASKKKGEPIAVDPLNSQVLYVGGFASGLQRSLDRGVSWEPIASIPVATERGEHVRTVEMATPSVLVDAGGGTVDGRSRRVYVGVFGHGIYRSEDGGQSFERISQTITAPFTMRLDASGALYVSTGEGLYRFEDGAWSESLLEDVDGFDVDPRDPSRLVAVAGGVWRSLDRGATWTQLSPVLGDSHGWWQTWGNQWGGPNAITLDPHRPGRALFVTCYMCYHTEDIWGPEQITWDNWYQGIEETVSFEIMTPPGSDFIYTGFGDIKSLRHRDLVSYPGQGDATPRHVVPGLDYFPGDPKQLWHVAVGGWKYHGIEVYRSLDAGDSWERVGQPFGTGQRGKKPMAMAAVAVSATDPDNVVVCSVLAKDGNAYTTDGGTTWQRCAGLPDNLMGHNPKEYWYFGNVLASDKVAGRFYAYDYRHGDGSKGRLYASDNGAEWTVVCESLPSSGTRQKLVTIFAAHDQAGWLALSAAFAETGMISRDAGASWQPIPGFSRIANADFGKAAPGVELPSLVVNGQREGGAYGIWHSPDYFSSEDPTWTLISLPDFPLMEPRELRGCKQEYGRVFVSEGGRGWVYGRIAEGD